MSLRTRAELASIVKTCLEGASAVSGCRPLALVCWAVGALLADRPGTEL